MKTFRTKNEAKKFVRDSIKAYDGDMQLFPTTIEAGGEKQGEYFGKVALENTKDEAKAFVEKFGDEIEVTIVGFDPVDRAERHKPAPKPGKTSRLSPDTGIAPRDKRADVDDDDPRANPRREGTHGYNSWEILRAHWEANKGKPMRFEDYVKAGGRANDLRWDWERGHVKMLNGETGEPMAIGETVPAN